MEFLSEDSIKRATLAFLKTYYKFRPRNGETVVSEDRMHSSGIIVDGYLEFPNENGSPFVATFESTSSLSSSEVRFSLQRQQLLWDSLAVSSVLTLVVMLLLWFKELWSVMQMGWVFSFMTITTLMTIFVIVFHFLCRKAGRYRYIYAIEQFKQYHADEQWIAVGYDVFPDNGDHNFTELKNQCVENGFGLVIVNKGEHVNLLITPAREEVFGKKRRQLKFMENPSVQSLKNYSKKNLERYRQPYFAQAMACVLSGLVLSGVFYRQWQNRPHHEVTQILSYQDSLARLSERLQPEAEMMVYKKEDVAEAVQNVQPYAETYVANELDQTAKPMEVGLYVYTPTDGYLSYDCARAGVRGVKFVVQDQLYRTFAEAQKRIESLKIHGLIANAISLTCTESNINGYCVYFELMYNDERAANAKAVQLQKDLRDLRLPFDYIKIRTLKF